MGWRSSFEPDKKNDIEKINQSDAVYYVQLGQDLIKNSKITGTWAETVEH